MRRIVLAVAGVVAATLIVPVLPAQSATTTTSPARADDRAALRTPPLRVVRLVKGLDLPWDVKQIGGGRLLITERDSKRLLTWYRGKLRRVAFPSGRVWASGETGLMSLAIDPKFGKNRRIYTCQGASVGGGRHDVRVLAWRLSTGAKRARLIRPLVTGLPSTSGRHGGCRLLITRSGALVVGTGDAATGTNPRSLTSLGGKTLRLNRLTGKPWPSNPYIGSSLRTTRLIYTFGHRNVQGLAQRRDGSLWSVEHGSSRDDEINRLAPGADFGWNPVPGYDESVPMTDQGLPGTQTEAKWRSGPTTIATSGAAWVSGKRWGTYDGTMAVAALKGQRVLFMRYDAAGTLRTVRTPAALQRFGRLRSVTSLPNGDLLITTSNGSRSDAVLRVRPGG